ncbi:hypothetical protein CVT24_007020 [Panaeolus cyanescens]|uniref:Shr3 amino acid permease chaperone n=1 Tax=Panaeolus cyanescens TaxID=181874 RepID=A0A409YLS3_9AGAR|nr:hypothetical protein CVT24_007020 [Panaeolus cyanescens]
MGVRAAVVVCALFTHWIADSLTLWKSPVTDDHLWTAAYYYSIITKGPKEALYFLAAIVILGASTLLWSLNDLRAGNIMFDGGSIFLFATTVLMYTNTVLPSLYAKFSTLPFHSLKDPMPRLLRNATLELASNHLICSVALTGILALQAGRFWVESTEDEEDDFVVAESDAATQEHQLKGRKSRAKTPEISIREDKVKPFLQQRVQAT